MSLKINQHKVWVNAPRDIVFAQVLCWGESSWWPKKSLMRFVNLSGQLEVGTVYRQKVGLPFAPSWESKISKIEPKSKVRRDFVSGMFKGSFEEVCVEPQDKGCLVEYNMRYQVLGKVNQVLWRLAFEKLHNKNIEMILKSLKGFCE